MTEVQSGRNRSTAELTRALAREAARLGEKPPRYQRVRDQLGRLDAHLIRSVARHGKRTGLADGIVHGAVRAERAHEVWELDEMELPIWIKTYSPKLNTHVAVQPSVCLVIDCASRVIVGYYIADPLARGVLSKMDRWDVKAALVSAMFPARHARGRSAPHRLNKCSPSVQFSPVFLSNFTPVLTTPRGARAALTRNHGTRAFLDRPPSRPGLMQPGKSNGLATSNTPRVQALS
jgi:hypothetical protein